MTPVYFNTKLLGHAYQQEDGYYLFQPKEHDDMWSEFGLRLVADKLQELNKPMDELINKYYEGH